MGDILMSFCKNIKFPVCCHFVQSEVIKLSFSEMQMFCQ